MYTFGLVFTSLKLIDFLNYLLHIQMGVLAGLHIQTQILELSMLHK